MMAVAVMIPAIGIWIATEIVTAIETMTGIATVIETMTGTVTETVIAIGIVPAIVIMTGIATVIVTATETVTEIERKTVTAIVPLTETVNPEEKDGNPECFHLFQVRPVVVRNSCFW